MNEYAFADLTIGQAETLTIALEQRHVDDFIALSGDASIVHLSDEYARSRGFEQRLVHGVLVASFVSQFLGMRLPGKHGVLRSLQSDFRQPCYAPSTLTIRGTVARLVPSLRLVGLAIEVADAAGNVRMVAKAESVLKY